MPSPHATEEPVPQAASAETVATPPSAEGAGDGAIASESSATTDGDATNKAGMTTEVAAVPDGREPPSRSDEVPGSTNSGRVVDSETQYAAEKARAQGEQEVAAASDKKPSDVIGINAGKSKENPGTPSSPTGTGVSGGATEPPGQTLTDAQAVTASPREALAIGKLEGMKEGLALARAVLSRAARRAFCPRWPGAAGSALGAAAGLTAGAVVGVGKGVSALAKPGKKVPTAMPASQVNSWRNATLSADMEKLAMFAANFKASGDSLKPEDGSEGVAAKLKSMGDAAPAIKAQVESLIDRASELDPASRDAALEEIGKNMKMIEQTGAETENFVDKHFKSDPKVLEAQRALAEALSRAFRVITEKVKQFFSAVGAKSTISGTAEEGAQPASKKGSGEDVRSSSPADTEQMA